MRKHQLVLLLGAFICAAAFSEESGTEEKKAATPISMVAYAGYFGELISHPGAIAGVDFPLLSKGKLDLYAGIQTGYYYHRLNSHGLFAQALLRAQGTFASGFFLDAALGAGYLHAIPDGTVYEVRDGQAVAVPNYGNPNFMPSLSLGAGYKFWKRGPAPLAASLNLGVFGEYPFNTYMFPRCFLSLTCFYRIQGASK